MRSCSGGAGFELDLFPAPGPDPAAADRLIIGTAEVERILDDGLFSGPAKLGPIAAAIRNTIVERKKGMIERPQASRRPHVVLLGAGASRAACPGGDAASRPIPLMDDLVETLNLGPMIRRSGVRGNGNFEKIYSTLAGPRHDVIREQLERRVETYFSSLVLPEEATVYDRMLLSLRPEDAVFTFNWDPFLFDAYTRNRGAVTLPEIFFLHGNVRIGQCPTHSGLWGRRHAPCPKCGEPFKKIPLLYPVENKDYSDDPFVSDSWRSAKLLLRQALILTVFGYSAPTSDVAAVALLKSAWMAESARKMEHVEVIDIIREADLYERWEKFTPTGHLHTRQDFSDSWIAKWPRRSCEAVFEAMSRGIPSVEFPLSDTNDLVQLQAQVSEIAGWEIGEHDEKK